MEIARYFQEVELLLLHLREEGHSLSSEDLQVLEAWWDGGVPLTPVLAGVRKGAARLARRKRRPRGLRLKAVGTDVAREVKRAASRGVVFPRDDTPDVVPPPGGEIPWGLDDPPDPIAPDGAGGGYAPDEGDERVHAARVAEALAAEAARIADTAPEAAALVRSVAGEAADLGAERAYVRLVEVSRAFYAARLDALDAVPRGRLLAESRASLGPAAARMKPQALEETVRELALRRVMAEDPVLDPDRVLEILP